jgi:hypothetical protein
MKETSPIGDTIVITSHTCTFNLCLCLGGGGFDCIAIYAGGGYAFDLSPKGPDGGPLEIAPPFRGTILGGTGSFEGIEGTVDVVTITGTTGPIALIDTGLRALLPEGWFKAVDTTIRMTSDKSYTWIAPEEYALKGFEQTVPAGIIIPYSVSNVDLINVNECWVFQMDDSVWINFDKKIVTQLLGYNEIKVAPKDCDDRFQIDEWVVTDVDKHVWVKTCGDLFPNEDTGCLWLPPSDLLAR